MSEVAAPGSHPDRAGSAIEEAASRAREAAAGRTDQIVGPRAIGVPLRRFAGLVWTIAVSDFKLRFYGSALGYVWQVMRPLLLFGVLYLFFTQILRFQDVAYYPVVLLQGIVIFTFLSETTTASLTGLVDRENLVRKIQFPRLAVPFAIVLTAFFNLMINYVVVFAFLIIQGGSPHWTWLYEFPFLLAALVFVATSISVLLSALYVRYRDVRPIWEVLLQTLYFVSLILIPIESISNQDIQKLLLVSPFACIVEQLRHAVIDPAAPTVSQVLGSPWLVAIPVSLALLLALVSYIVFNRMAPRVAEEL
ncbi:MAG: ABC transporter permease [Acidobacteria bacterium]|nr:ABC transporter permease [Acidobacteriota bacterium]